MAGPQTQEGSASIVIRLLDPKVRETLGSIDGVAYWPGKSDKLTNELDSSVIGWKRESLKMPN
jgi:hypothetical protein